LNTEYFLVFTRSLEFEGFRLRENEYEAIAPISRAGVGVKYWVYLGVEAGQCATYLRGQKVPTPEEAAQQEQRRAEQEQQH